VSGQIKRNKTLVLYDKLLSEIKSGKYSEGSFFPTEIELASKFAVSRSTINRVIQRLKNEGFVSRKAGFGTIVARKDNSEIDRIGLLFPCLSNSEIFEPICKSLIENSSKYNMSISWAERNFNKTVSEIKSDIDEICNNYKSEGLKGVFISPVSRIPHTKEINEHIIFRFSESQMQIVLLDRDVIGWPNRSGFDLVSSDNLLAGYTVAKHLIDTGANDIVFVCPQYSADPAYQRFIGAKEAIGKCEKKSNIKMIIIPYHNTKELIELIYERNGGKPDAIIGSNDTVATKIFQSCMNKNLSIPKDFLLAGFDDVFFASNLGVPLTSYQQPYKEISLEALRLMYEKLKKNKNDIVKTILVKGKLNIRNSTYIDPY